MTKKNENLKTTLSRLYIISQAIPALGSLYKGWSEEWHGMQDDDNKQEAETAKEVREEIKSELNKWLDTAEIEEIIHCLTKLKTVVKQRGSLKMIKEMAGHQYKWMFDSDSKLIPADTFRPVIFFPVRRKTDPETGRTLVHHLKKPIVKYFRGGKLTIKSILPTTRALKTLTALVYIMKNTVPEVTRKYYSFVTSKEEILKIKGIKHPSQTSREAIWNDFEELCSVVLEIEWKGKRFLGSILDGSRTELEENSAGELEIFINRDFMQLYESGYLELDIKTIHALSDKELNLIGWLKAKKPFNSGQTIRVGIRNLYDWANLNGNESEPPPKRRMKADINMLLKKLSDRSLISSFYIKNDNYHISKRRQEQPSE